MSEWDKSTKLITLHNKQDEKGVIKFIKDNMDDLTPNLSDVIIESITLTPKYVKENIIFLKKLHGKLSPTGLRASMRLGMLETLIEKVDNE